ncbi:bifunctional lysylphosphatidylglycerol flippase/synthetase MprF [Lysinimonas soli]|uniref:Bifunctional lysylphosphatidylglycerol flippase/synthetase MprF n=1 Tax=Lysinimonas soli TaxID=1074233 RepID=A0ABW0NNC7_9MICO
MSAAAVTARDAPARARRRVGFWLSQLRNRPVTIGIAVVLIVVWIIALGTGRQGPFAPALAGIGPHLLQQRHWWGLFTSLVDAGTIVQLIIAVIATLLAVGTAERLMGSLRTAIAFVVTGLIATAAGVGLVTLGMQFHEFWSTSVHGVVTLDPLTPIAGTLAWASAWATTLWRRRFRTILIASASALLLYSGQPADLYLLVAIGLGIGLGALTHRERGPVLWRGSRHETRTLLAVTTVILAIGPLLTVLSATRYGVLSPLGVAISNASPSGVDHAIGCIAGRIAPGCVSQLTHLPLHSVGATLVSLLPLALMVVLARGLLAGRRAALGLLVVMLVAESLLAAWYLGVVPAFGSAYALPFAPQRQAELALWLVVSALVPLAFAVVLITQRRAFPVRTSPSSIRRYLAAIAGAVIVPSALYLGFGWMLRAGFSPVPSFGELLSNLPQRFIPIEFLSEERRDFRPVSPLAHLVTQSVGPLFWIAVVVATVLFLRARSEAVADSAEHTKLRELLAVGSGTLGFMSTWEGNRLWLDHSGTFGIAYRVVNGYAVTTSDPIGRAADPDAALTEFLAFCDSAAWTPVFYSVHEEWRDRLAARGWSSIPVAQETTIDPRAFTLEGKVMHDVRYSVNRAAREGIRAVWARWDELPHRVARQISALSEEWMSEKDLPELGFTLGGLDELSDDEVLVGVALDEADVVQAVTSWLPVRRDGVIVGRTLDFMRRNPQGANGVMEFLIADGLRLLGEQGLELASLSGSPLAASADGPQATGALARVLRLVGRMLEPVYGFSSLLRFKRKFAPTLHSMYLSYRDPVQLPGIGMAIARCYLPTMTLRQATRAFGGRG